MPAQRIRRPVFQKGGRAYIAKGVYRGGHVTIDAFLPGERAIVRSGTFTATVPLAFLQESKELAT